MTVSSRHAARIVWQQRPLQKSQPARRTDHTERSFLMKTAHNNDNDVRRRFRFRATNWPWRRCSGAGLSLLTSEGNEGKALLTVHCCTLYFRAIICFTLLCVEWMKLFRDTNWLAWVENMWFCWILVCFTSTYLLVRFVWIIPEQ